MDCSRPGWTVRGQDGLFEVRMDCSRSGWTVRGQDGLFEVRMDCSKHLEFFTKINLRNSAFRLAFITRIYHDARCSECHTSSVGRYSDWVRGGRSGDRIPVEARFSAPIETGPGTHPASSTMCTGSLSCGKGAVAWY
jgi:hypothetical protein